jgi:hypothetical protein
VKPARAKHTEQARIAGQTVGLPSKAHITRVMIASHHMDRRVGRGCGCVSATANSTSTGSEDKSQEIAQFIQERVNTGGYTGCVARRIGNQLVEVKLNFPAGTSRATVEANVSGVADQFAQVGRLASTIFYRGYSGEQRVCEYKYDPYSATVKKVR